MIDLRSAPEPLSRREHLLLGIATVVTAATRIWGRARSPWDWDEILFSLGLRHYDVALHHPHPPGFPIFIATAKMLRGAGLSDFHSLQALNLAAGVLLVPATFFFCRELRLRFPTSLFAGLLLAFFPNVWFFGETAFSDVPSIVLVIAGCGLLTRGCRSSGSYVAGAVVVAIAAGCRPQNLIVALAPALIATWCCLRERRPGVVVAAAIAVIVIIGGSYGMAALETGGWDRYREALRAHQQYITETDSFRNPNRPPLRHLLDDFFVRPYRAPLINFTVTALALISLVTSMIRRRIPIVIVVAAFAPLCLAAWLLLDHFSASRFSIGYAPLIAILAADGIALISFGRQIVAWAAGLALTALMLFWTAPTVDLIRRSDPPPLQAIEWIRAHVPPSSSVIYVHEGMGPYAEYFLGQYRVEWTLEGPPIARLDPALAWYLREGRSDRAGAINFSWPHDRAWNVARRRYFDVSLVPLTATARFVEGWYGEEVTGKSVWRWMGGRGSIELPPVEGKARLRLRIFVPLHVMRGAPSILIRMNGAVIRAVHPGTPFVDIVHDFDAGGGARTLEIETDRVVNPLREHLGGDSRDLGVRLDQLEWIAREP